MLKIRKNYMKVCRIRTMVILILSKIIQQVILLPLDESRGLSLIIHYQSR